jgi:hypothetical protein
MGDTCCVVLLQYFYLLFNIRVAHNTWFSVVHRLPLASSRRYSYSSTYQMVLEYQYHGTYTYVYVLEYYVPCGMAILLYHWY